MKNLYKFLKLLYIKVKYRVIIRNGRLEITYDTCDKIYRGPKLEAHFDTLHSKLVNCERECHQLKEGTFLLELALWKTKIHESGLEREDNVTDREQCRINCGADIIILNVLPYLIANSEVEDNHNNVKVMI